MTRPNERVARAIHRVAGESGWGRLINQVPPYLLNLQLERGYATRTIRVGFVWLADWMG